MLLICGFVKEVKSDLEFTLFDGTGEIEIKLENALVHDDKKI